MRDVNRDLQAGHQLLHLFERSKLQLDAILDRQPALFAIVDLCGRMLRASEPLAQQLQLSAGDCVGQNIAPIFSPDAWQLFKSRLAETTKNSSSTPFELPIENVLQKHEPIPVFWRMERFVIEGRSDLQLAVISGHDISELRRAERQLSNVLSTSPLGILTVETDGRIAPVYSHYCEWLLGNKDLNGAHVYELLYAGSEDNLTLAQSDAVENMLGQLGKDNIDLASMRENLPLEFLYVSARDPSFKRWLHLDYHPIEVGGRFTKILLILQDRTSEIELRRLREQSVLLADEATQRVLQVKKSRSNLLQILVKDFADVFDQLEDAVKHNRWEEVARALHGIKGNARIVEYHRLANLAHDFESLLAKPQEDPMMWNREVFLFRDKIVEEWKEIRNLIFALHKEVVDVDAAKGDSDSVNDDFESLLKRYQTAINSPKTVQTISTARLELALKTLNSSPLAEMEIKLEAQVKKIAEETGKSIDLVCTWNDIRVDQQVWGALGECLLHIINNSVVHGIETPEQRQKSGKRSGGLIGVDCSEEGSKLICEIWDDGGGIDLKAVRAKAIQRQLVPMTEIVNWTDAQLMRLIFHPGISTAGVLDQKAGRGVGLSAVQERVKQLRGEIEVYPRTPSGTRFQVILPVERAQPRRKLIVLSEFLSRLRAEIETQHQEIGLGTPKWILPDLSENDFFIYADIDSLLLAMSTLIANIAASGEIEITVQNNGEKLTLDTSIYKSKPRFKLSSEFKITLSASHAICFLHQGQISHYDRRLQISCGHILQSDQLPVLKIVAEEGLAVGEMSATIKEIEKLGQLFGVTVLKPGSGERSGTLVYLRREKKADEAMSLTCGANPSILKEEFIRALGYHLI